MSEVTYIIPFLSIFFSVLIFFNCCEFGWIFPCLPQEGHYKSPQSNCNAWLSSPSKPINPHIMGKLSRWLASHREPHWSANQIFLERNLVNFSFQNRQCHEMRRRLTEYLLGIWTGYHLLAQRYLFKYLFSIPSLPFFTLFICSKVVRIFTSSTFTDMLMERNTLMEYVYPKIKEYCREKHGLEYQVRTKWKDLLENIFRWWIWGGGCAMKWLMSTWQRYQQIQLNIVQTS